MNTNLLCKDCKNSFVPIEQLIVHLGMRRFIDPVFYRCKLTRQEKHIKFNPVTGAERVETKYDTCAFARLEYGHCGSSGKHWVPRHKKHLFLAITRGET